ncbi:MAG: transposase [Gammaproteobacteria bacterium]|nr:transposase [Gammaproteobacteria bacterium]
MIAEVNTMAQFTAYFTHHKTKGSHQAARRDEIFFAGIFALGSNIGLHKLVLGQKVMK